jgi:hypothetical protein
MGLSNLASVITVQLLRIGRGCIHSVSSKLAWSCLQHESYALDPENAKALWRKSEEMVGETFA